MNVVADAAEQAAAEAIHDRMAELHRAMPGAGGKTPDWWPELAEDLAAHVLAVLSQTHVVVKLPADDDGYEYGIRRDELIDRHPDMAYCNGVLDQEVARDVARWNPEVTLVRRVYGPWTPVSDQEAPRG